MNKEKLKKQIVEAEILSKAILCLGGAVSIGGMIAYYFAGLVKFSVITLLMGTIFLTLANTSLNALVIAYLKSKL